MKNIAFVIFIITLISSKTFAQNGIRWIWPISAQQGQSIQTTVESDALFSNGDSVVFSQGGKAIFYSRTGWTQMFGDILHIIVTVPKNAPVGVYDVSINSVGNLILKKAFTVTQLQLFSSPKFSYVGQKIKVDITGLKTHFKDAGTNVWFDSSPLVYNQGTITIKYSKLTADSLSIQNDSSLTCYKKIPITIPHGFYNLKVIDKTDGILVEYGAIKFTGKATGMSPDFGIQNRRVNITVSGIPGSFDSGFVYLKNIGLTGFSQGTQTTCYADSATLISSDTLIASIPITVDTGKYQLFLRGLN